MLLPYRSVRQCFYLLCVGHYTALSPIDLKAHLLEFSLDGVASIEQNKPPKIALTPHPATEDINLRSDLNPDDHFLFSSQLINSSSQNFPHNGERHIQLMPFMTDGSALADDTESSDQWPSLVVTPSDPAVVICSGQLDTGKGGDISNCVMAPQSSVYSLDIPDAHTSPFTASKNIQVRPNNHSTQDQKSIRPAHGANQPSCQFMMLEDNQFVLTYSLSIACNQRKIRIKCPGVDEGVDQNPNSHNIVLISVPETDREFTANSRSGSLNGVSVESAILSCKSDKTPSPPRSPSPGQDSANSSNAGSEEESPPPPEGGDQDSNDDDSSNGGDRGGGRDGNRGRSDGASYQSQETQEEESNREAIAFIVQLLQYLHSIRDPRFSEILNIFINLLQSHQDSSAAKSSIDFLNRLQSQPDLINTGDGVIDLFDIAFNSLTEEQQEFFYNGLIAAVVQNGLTDLSDYIQQSTLFPFQQQEESLLPESPSEASPLPANSGKKPKANPVRRAFNRGISRLTSLRIASIRRIRSGNRGSEKNTRSSPVSSSSSASSGQQARAFQTINPEDSHWVPDEMPTLDSFEGEHLAPEPPPPTEEEAPPPYGSWLNEQGSSGASSDTSIQSPESSLTQSLPAVFLGGASFQPTTPTPQEASTPARERTPSLITIGLNSLRRAGSFLLRNRNTGSAASKPTLPRHSYEDILELPEGSTASSLQSQPDNTPPPLPASMPPTRNRHQSSSAASNQPCEYEVPLDTLAKAAEAKRRARRHSYEEIDVLAQERTPVAQQPAVPYPDAQESTGTDMLEHEALSTSESGEIDGADAFDIGHSGSFIPAIPPRASRRMTDRSSDSELELSGSTALTVSYRETSSSTPVEGLDHDIQTPSSDDTLQENEENGQHSHSLSTPVPLAEEELGSFVQMMLLSSPVISAHYSPQVSTSLSQTFISEASLVSDSGIDSSSLPTTDSEASAPPSPDKKRRNLPAAKVESYTYFDKQ